MGVLRIEIYWQMATFFSRLSFRKKKITRSVAGADVDAAIAIFVLVFSVCVCVMEKVVFGKIVWWSWGHSQPIWHLAISDKCVPYVRVKYNLSLRLIEKSRWLRH